MQVSFPTTKSESLKPSRSTGASKREKSSFFAPVVQPKLKIGAADDAYEREADSIADRVVGINEGKTGSPLFTALPGQAAVVQRVCAECEEEEEKKVHRKETTGTSAGMTAPAVVNDVISTPGQTLDSRTQSFMESSFGNDFGNVRIHNDSLAHQSSAGINAKAYTIGNHIVFGEGEYQPSSDEGRHLLAHELTHVVQQGNDRTIRRQENEPAGKEIPLADSFIFITTYGDRTGTDDIQGIADKDIVQKLGDIYRDKSICWNGEYVGLELNFGTAPIPAGGASPRQIPPAISAKLSYKEAGGFTTYRYEGADASPVWYPGVGNNVPADWHPNMQTLFTYPLNKRATLNIHVEMMDIEDDRLLVYDDSITFVKCGVVTGCREDSLATSRWAVIPANGGPVHPASKTQHDDGPRYEIFKENGKDSYFICLDESTRRPVTWEGDQL